MTVVGDVLPAGGPVPSDVATAVRTLVDQPGLVALHLQPVVDLAAAEVAGWEALMRPPASWGIAPDLLFAAAHEIGLSGPLERIVLERAVRLLDRLPANTFLTVNVDPADLVDEAAVAPLLERPSLSRLVVEVTEHGWPDPADVLTVLGEMRSRGALVAADDVGSGYASLNQLMRLRPQIVKMDRELIVGLGEDPAAETMVRSLGELCGSLDAWVVAEGVETVAQLTSLARAGVPLVQGWLLGRPGPGFVGLDDPELVRRHAAMATLDDTIVSLLVPLPASHRRDEAGRHWLGLAPDPCATFAPSTRLQDAATRAVNRPLEQRWDPLLVTDGVGSAIGVVPLEALVVAVARAATTPGAAPPASTASPAHGSPRTSLSRA